MTPRKLSVGAVALCTLALSLPATRAGDDDGPDARRAAIDKGLAWLVAHQAEDGSWGKTYTVAVTSYGCLALLAAQDEPFEGDRAAALERGLAFLLASQTDGVFVHQGHTWIHGQGFATLALAEAYGRSLTAKAGSKLGREKLRTVVEQAVAAIQKNQSTSGGWWYTPGSPGNHEGSTTCCAVQALVSADNFGIAIDAEVLRKGFDYLKQCQNPDGGFDYSLGPTTNSMLEGTAGGVATLGLMRKFDYAVMMNGQEFLLKTTPQAISQQRFPYYGHFYGVMGMQLLGQEMDYLIEKTDGYVDGALADLRGWQREDGSWPVKSWVRDHGKEDDAYGTSFAALTLAIRDRRLSIFDRDRPELPKESD